MTEPEQPTIEQRREALRLLTSRETLIVASGLALLIIQRYHRVLGLVEWRHMVVEWHAVTVACLFVVPALICMVGLRVAPAQMGMGWGKPRIWGRYLVVYAAVMVPVVLVASRVGHFRGWYPIYQATLTRHYLVPISIASFGAYFFAWEFFFRGYLLFGLEQRFGAYAVLVQALPFVLVHLGKPEAEVYGAIIAGLALGLMAYRGRSVWPCFLLHWGVATLLDLLIIFWPAGP